MAHSISVECFKRLAGCNRRHLDLGRVARLIILKNLPCKSRGTIYDSFSIAPMAEFCTDPQLTTKHGCKHWHFGYQSAADWHASASAKECWFVILELVQLETYFMRVQAEHRLRIKQKIYNSAGKSLFFNSAWVWFYSRTFAYYVHM